MKIQVIVHLDNKTTITCGIECIDESLYEDFKQEIQNVFFEDSDFTFCGVDGDEYCVNPDKISFIQIRTITEIHPAL